MLTGRTSLQFGRIENLRLTWKLKFDDNSTKSAVVLRVNMPTQDSSLLQRFFFAGVLVDTTFVEV